MPEINMNKRIFTLFTTLMILNCSSVGIRKQPKLHFDQFDIELAPEFSKMNIKKGQSHIFIHERTSYNFNFELVKYEEFKIDTNTINSNEKIIDFLIGNDLSLYASCDTLKLAHDTLSNQDNIIIGIEIPRICNEPHPFVCKYYVMPKTGIKRIVCGKYVSMEGDNKYINNFMKCIMSIKIMQ
jgi:hypothetical protein